MNLFEKIRLFLIERKNRQIFLLAISAILIFLIATAVLLAAIKKSFSQKKQLKNQQQTVNVAKVGRKDNGEVITAAAFSINCQVAVTTSLKKIFLGKFERCKEVLSYKISPNGQYLTYNISLNNKTQIFVYSLENNIEGLLDTVLPSITDFVFTQSNNLAILDQQFFTYYFIPLLFNGYPDNFNQETNSFVDVEKKKVKFSLPNLQKKYTKILEKNNEFDLLDQNNQIIYIVPLKDINVWLTPTSAFIINKELLNWSKRIFFYDKDGFKTVDITGENEINHRFICQEKESLPINFFKNLFARSVDGRQLAFLIKQGEIVLYDLAKDECEATGQMQTGTYRENFSFSPDGTYLAYVDRGVNLYHIQKRQSYQLSSHNPIVGDRPTVITGPLIWDGASRFIYTTVSQLQNGVPSSTKLVRVYFNERFEGRQQEAIDQFPINSLYAVSSDGNKIIYTKDNNIFIFDVEKRLNKLFKTLSSQSDINKVVWLRNNMIVSNLWAADEKLNFKELPKNQDFQIDYDGENFIYQDDTTLRIFDLTKNRSGSFKKVLTPQGVLLKSFY